MLAAGYFEGFLGGLGRADLGQAARQATNWLAGSAFWPTPVPGTGITQIRLTVRGTVEGISFDKQYDSLQWLRERAFRVGDQFPLEGRSLAVLRLRSGRTPA